ncbi:hypothetical protein VNO77_21717 [Canavalia gladiata]|uniref:Uncharacterized protein n=1 Tax=Canavalia gladiata TaxID=3824 RepID=A0AAN9QDV4_CANGL
MDLDRLEQGVSQHHNEDLVWFPFACDSGDGDGGKETEWRFSCDAFTVYEVLNGMGNLYQVFVVLEKNTKKVEESIQLLEAQLTR